MQALRPTHVWLGMTILVLHVAGAVVWWWLLPGGFPLPHPRFWANRALPFAILCVPLIGLWALRRNSPSTWRAVLFVFPALWVACGVSIPLVFPISGRWGWGLLVWGLWLGSLVWRGQSRPWVPDRKAIVAVLSAAAVGVGIPFSQRAPAASTRPVDVPLPELPARAESHSAEMPFTLGEGVQVLPSESSIHVRYETFSVTIQPLLTFISRSPDRCWSALVPRAAREGPRRRLTGSRVEQHTARLTYQNDVTSLLTIHADGTGEPISIDAFSRLDQPIDSHLNSFCDVEVSGFRELSLSFSPCPDAKIDVTVSDYPVGRPARMAFLDADGLFQVVEATSGEKGPFHRLAAGPMRSSDPLVITLHDGGDILCHIAFDDWASQVSTELSPTAGWGVPMNAIEFSRIESANSGNANIWISLAGTSVGRGWDTVGHTPGVYRNRIRVSR